MYVHVAQPSEMYLDSSQIWQECRQINRGTAPMVALFNFEQCPDSSGLARDRFGTARGSGKRQGAGAVSPTQVGHLARRKAPCTAVCTVTSVSQRRHFIRTRCIWLGLNMCMVSSSIRTGFSSFQQECITTVPCPRNRTVPSSRLSCSHILMVVQYRRSAS